MDIDIDCWKHLVPEKVFPYWTRGSTVERGKLEKHIVGGYFQMIPKDQITGLSAIPYKEAEKLGFLKIDFLHLNLLDNINSKEQLRELASKEPNWDLLNDKTVVEKLFHISKHYDLVSIIKPRSIDTLADVLMLIRPGKLHLIDKYIESPEIVKSKLYEKTLPSDLRRSHAIAYAVNIVVQLNLLGIKNDFD